MDAYGVVGRYMDEWCELVGEWIEIDGWMDR